MDRIVLHQYLRIIQRWWWLLAVGAAIPMAVGYQFASNQPDLYQATVTLMVGTSLQSANPDPRLMATSSTLADAYARLVTLDPITEAVVDRLGLDRSPAQLASQITTWVHPEAQLLEIRVVDTNPRAAVLIANALAEELIASTPASDEVQQAEAAFTRRQLDDLRSRIERVQADVQELGASMVDLTSAAEIQEAQERLDGLRRIESMYQSTYAQLLQSYGGSSPNILRIFDPAVEPRRPIGRNTWMIAAISGASGVGLALAAALAIEYLDDSVHWEGQAKEVLLNLPVLGALVEVPGVKGSIADAFDPESLSAGMVRTLRTQIVLAADLFGTLLVTSPGPRAGKTAAVAQLGLVIAAGGDPVIVVDADLRKPSLHELFDLPNASGLSELLAGDTSLSDFTWLLKTGVENLRLIPAGKPPLDPGRLLTTSRLGELFSALKKRKAVILIDGPPVLTAPDAALLASAADGTMLVVSADTTSHGRALEAKERLSARAGANLLGVVFNRVRLNGDAHYSYSKPHSRARGIVRALRAWLPFAGDGRRTGGDHAVLGLAEMASYLGVTPARARRWCKSGRLPAHRSWRQWCIKESDLRDAVERMVRSEDE